MGSPVRGLRHDQEKCWSLYTSPVGEGNFPKRKIFLWIFPTGRVNVVLYDSLTIEFPDEVRTVSQ